MVFLYTILTGMLAGFLYDVYAGLGSILRLKKIGTLLGDILYWVCSSVMVYALLLFYNQGEVRFFVLLGLGAGALCYFRLSRRRMRYLVIKTIELIIWLVNWLINILLYPIRLLYLIATFPFKIVGLFTCKICHIFIQIFKRLLPASTKLLFCRCQEWLSRALSRIKRKV
ncbi:spore cortex biosynthesis protein YabQ [Sporotomaculum syntrophicum]